MRDQLRQIEESLWTALHGGAYLLKNWSAKDGHLATISDEFEAAAAMSAVVF